ncbi:hypothetical protein K7X08_002911 [Anisodus acutangulus]|uniref:VQ domain-containing protein n=1 Tax=Anisodus acutangulus TaxID=402998 RepID=A0A9Q1MFR6_9SOLA|nr:hypothetical protein K7X08_002911 [Anisodus acutangulus]
MDSGINSASLQSSSGGGDEEYDSRASDSFSSAFHTQNSSMFDPFANYFNPISRPQLPPPPPPHNYTTTSSLFNLDTGWSKTLRSDHNNPMLLPSSNKSLSFGTGVSFPSAPVEHGGGGSMTVTTIGMAAAPPAGQPIIQPARNPKKRSRASRRAPTTVLTTDATNFRAMVQEFTGIPAPPFTSYFPRNRFDIFASAATNSSLRSAAAVGASSNNNNPLNISQLPNYLRRPFPQKIQSPPPFLSPPSSSSSSSLMLSCFANDNIASGSSSTTSAPSNSTINYQLPSGVVSSVAQSSNNLFSTIQQNSILTSLLQSSQKYPLGSSKDQKQFQMPSNNSSQMKIGSVLEQYSMNNAQYGHLLSGLPNLISPEQAAASSRNENSNIGASTTNFHGDNKVQETVASRGGEGMVESWICSSD